MRHFFKKINLGLKRLQRSHDRTKKRWLVGLSAASLVIVIALRLLSLGGGLPQVGVAPGSGGAPAAVSEESFIRTFSRGFEVVIGDIKTKLGGLAARLDSLNRSNEFIVSPNFQDAD